jgi:hypothetical protein
MTRGVVDTFASEDFDRNTRSCVFLKVVNNKNFFFLHIDFLFHFMV